MLDNRSEGPVNLDIYRIDESRIRPHQRGVFDQLTEVAIMGGDIYAAQKEALESYEGPFNDNPFTIPDANGKFVHFDEHEGTSPILRRAQGKILIAAAAAETVGMKRFGKYLYVLGNNLPAIGHCDLTGRELGYNFSTEAYTSLQSPAFNFQFSTFEEDDSFPKYRKMWQAYLGVLDRSATREVAGNIKALRKAGIRRNVGIWFTPRTEMRVDNVKVMSGFLTSSTTRGDGFSAENLPNEDELANNPRGGGTKIMIFDKSFERAFTERILDRSAKYLDPLPTREGATLYVGAHELGHDERYPGSRGRLGRLYKHMRESFANNGGLDLCPDVWDSGNPQQAVVLGSIYRGLLGYTFGDCAPTLEMETVPDLGVLGKSIYVPGELGGLNIAVQENVFTFVDGRITQIDLDKAIGLHRRLAAEERKILKSGLERDARDYFEAILPRIPLFPRNTQG